MKNITLIIPAKHESESLPIVLNKLKKFKFNIIVVLHKSDIQTINAIKKFKVKILYQKNSGYGDALINGINFCKSEFFCIFKDKLDFVFGSRYQKNSDSYDDTIITFLGNYFFTKLGQIFFNLPITDILYTFVLGRTSSAKRLKLNQKKFAFCVELPIKAIKNGMNIQSSSALEFKRIAGKKKVNEFSDGLKILYYMIKFFFLSR